MVIDSIPHCIIAGVPRSGSTSLYTYLLHHPQICASTTKETQYFLPAGDGLPLEPLDRYRSYFVLRPGQTHTLEASPSYFYGGARTARAIWDTLGPTRLIFILRDPAHRFYSYFTHDKMYGLLPRDLTFEDFLQAPATRSANLIGSGYYLDYFQAWHDQFAGYIHLIFFDDLIQQPRAVMDGLTRWLGIEADFYADYAFTQENRGAVSKSKRLNTWARAINMRFEHFWRRNLALKRRLRGIYYAFNESKTQSSGLSPETAAYLSAHYRPYNDRLYAWLQAQGYPISGWLTACAPVSRPAADPTGPESN